VSGATETSKVTSKDGTAIAYERQGSGPAVMLVAGGLDDGLENGPLAAALASDFTAYNYNRRGRGNSGSTLPYALEREIEDIDALIAVAGGSAHVYGVSSGGALALEAASAGLAIDRVAVYEVPWNMAVDWPQRWGDYVAALEGALAEDRRGDAVELFLRMAGSSDEEVARVRSSPYWAGMTALAHTLAYDAACLGNGQPPVDRLAKITQTTLVATGAAHPDGSPEWVQALDAAADAIAARIARAERRVLEGQSHVVEPATFAPVLARFFAEGASTL
jgi:alpha-beta hydrolase superfamily lysophospholipase